jgi:hypothetical protein
MLSPRGPICVTKALAGAAPAPHGSSSRYVYRPPSAKVHRKMQGVLRSIHKLHAAHRNLPVSAKYAMPPQLPWRHHQGRTQQLDKSRPRGTQTDRGVEQRLELKPESDEEKERRETNTEVGLVSVPFALETLEKGGAVLSQGLKRKTWEAEELIRDLVTSMKHWYKAAESLHMRPVRIAIGDRLPGGIVVQARRQIARYERLIKIFEELEAIAPTLSYGALCLEVIDLLGNTEELYKAIESDDLHDGGRTVAYHSTQIAILSVVSTISVCAFLVEFVGVTAVLVAAIAELSTFGAILGIAALPLLFLKPPKGYQDPFDRKMKEVRAGVGGYTYSNEYMDAVNKYLHDPSPINLQHMNAIPHVHPL